MTQDDQDIKSSDKPAEDASDNPSMRGESYGLEGHDAQRSKKPHADLDVCPNCGAPMTDPQHLVCLRCGFDLKTLKVVTTKTGVQEVDADTNSDRAGAIVDFSAGGRGDYHLPLALAAVAGAVLVGGFLMGAEGLFPEVRAAAHAATSAASEDSAGARSVSISFVDRLLGLIRFLLRCGFWTGGGIVASFVTAHILGRRLGDLKLAAARLLGIVAVAQLASFIEIRARWLEWMVETGLEVATFIALAMFMFKLSARDAGTLAAMTMATILVVLGGAHLVAWLT